VGRRADRYRTEAVGTLDLRRAGHHIWASATKIIVGTLVHLMTEEGLVKLDDSVPQCLPELKGTAWDDVTVADVLHQRSGLDVSESRLGSAPDHPVTLFYAITGGDPNLPSDVSLMYAVKAAAKRLEPGGTFEYSSINTHVAALIVQEVTAKPLEDVITERIWSKAGMEGDAVLGLSASGEPMAYGAFAARLRDLGRFGLLFTPSWRTVAAERVIGEDYFAEVYAAAKPEVYGNDYMSQRLNNDFGEPHLGASYQWDAVFPDGDVYKSGRTGQCLYVSPETDTVLLTSEIDAKYKAHFLELQRIGWAGAAEAIRESHRADLHQALAYGLLADTPVVETVLAYPLADPGG
jgi:CubicO group peptidase (beta-lactamase class C family)